MDKRYLITASLMCIHEQLVAFYIIAHVNQTVRDFRSCQQVRALLSIQTGMQL